MKLKLFISLIMICGFAKMALASESSGIIDINHQYFWGENLGWLSAGCDNCQVVITDTAVNGYLWSRKYGWVNMSGVTNNCLGYLGGKAWSKTLGWLDFSGVIINPAGKFTGTAGDFDAKTGRINFDCESCDVTTDWRQCALRFSVPQVRINYIGDDTTPSISANAIITNEGSAGYEYQYEWCVVNSINNECGGSDDSFYASAAKYILPGETWETNLPATVLNSGNYWFKLVVNYNTGKSTSTHAFTARTIIVNPPGGGGGGGGGAIITPPIVETTTPPVEPKICSGADFNYDHKVNSIDFSILLAFWKTAWPFRNACVDINSDQQVNSVDFSILMYQWGKPR